VLLCGTPATLYVTGAGLTALVVLWWNGRRGSDGPLGAMIAAARGASATAAGRPAAAPCRRRCVAAVAVASAGVAWLLLLGAVGATKGAELQGYAYLVHGLARGGRPTLAEIVPALLRHPGEVLHVLSTHGWNIWANLAPEGLLGILTVPGFLLAVPTLLTENLLQVQAFSYPSFQSFVAYCFVAVGSVLVVAFLLRRRALWPFGVIAVAAVAADLGGWASVWLPATPARWVLTDALGASIVTQVAREAAPTDEVVASQGFVGVFAGRSQVYPFSGPTVVPLRSSTVWFVLSPDQGPEAASPDQTMEAVSTLQQLPGAREVTADDGVYVFRVRPPSGLRSLALAEPGAHLPAWVATGPAGFAETGGPPATWHAAPTGSRGYVVANDYFTEAPGSYAGRVRLRANVVPIVEVWDVYAHRLVGKAVVRPRRHAGTITVTVHFALPPRDAATEPPPPPSSVGSGIFRYSPNAPAAGPVVSIEVWTAPRFSRRQHEEIFWLAIGPGSRGDR
jgi:hypothetical protein